MSMEPVIKEKTAPGKEGMVKGIKKSISRGDTPKTYKDKNSGERKETNPWSIAQSAYNKEHGISESTSGEIYENDESTVWAEAEKMFDEFINNGMDEYEAADRVADNFATETDAWDDPIQPFTAMQLLTKLTSSPRHNDILKENKFVEEKITEISKAKKQRAEQVLIDTWTKLVPGTKDFIEKEIQK